jgi:hypothetical protein
VKLRTFLILTLTLGTSLGFAQAPSAPPEPPFHFNFGVQYVHAKQHPDIAALIYKMLRALPGIGIVTKTPMPFSSSVTMPAAPSTPAQ